MSQYSLHRLHFSAVVVPDFLLHSAHQCQCSSQDVHGPTVTIDPVAERDVRQHIRISVDLICSEDHRLSKFEFSEIEAEVVRKKWCEIIDQCVTVSNTVANIHRQLEYYIQGTQYILFALSYIWNCLKCVSYIILPCAKRKDASQNEVAILGQFRRLCGALQAAHGGSIPDQQNREEQPQQRHSGC